MSADNFVSVYPHDNNVWHVTDGSASVEEEDCQYRGDVVGRCSSRELALVEAHNYAKTLPVLEYGVIELPAIPAEFCGRCYVCIKERNIVAEDIERCDKCSEPFHRSDWRVGVMGKWYHNRCEPGR